MFRKAKLVHRDAKGSKRPPAAQHRAAAVVTLPGLLSHRMTQPTGDPCVPGKVTGKYKSVPIVASSFQEAYELQPDHCCHFTDGAWLLFLMAEYK